MHKECEMPALFNAIDLLRGFSSGPNQSKEKIINSLLKLTQFSEYSLCRRVVANHAYQTSNLCLETSGLNRQIPPSFFNPIQNYTLCSSDSFVYLILSLFHLAAACEKFLGHKLLNC